MLKFKIKKFALLPLFLSTAFVAEGQAVASEQSLLWQISGNGLSSSSYLFGTIHVLPQSRFFLPSHTEELLSSCDKVVLEIDLDDPSMVGELQKEMMMADNSIEKILSPAEYDLVAKFFSDSLSIPLSAVAKVKPLFLSTFILPKIIGQNPASYEGTFVQMAGSLGIEVVGLETVKEQVSYFDEISLEKQAKMLVDGIVDFSKSKAEYGAMLKAYETQNVEEIYLHMLKTSNEFKEFDEILLKQRNRAWVPRIGTLVSESKCFIAVGSGHLGGDEGVIALLRKAGYSVTPVN